MAKRAARTASVRHEPKSKNSDNRRRAGLDGAQDLAPNRNLLLAKLPQAEIEAFSARAERISCDTRDVLFANGDPITAIYFPVSAMISLLTVLSDGTTIEAMTIGYEGMAGLPLFHGVKTAQSKGVCQIEGDVYRIPADEFLDLVEQAPGLTKILHKYSQFMQDSMAQSAACNGVHLLEQRCARWLLLSSDAVSDGHFSLTQEFFAQMLAVRRSGITTTMGSLERKNLIATRYGTITIVDRDGLEKLSCECYKTLSKRRRDLLT
jgi:CRP-like cAMP-binding protein